MRFFRTPGRYANVTSTLALVVALGGTAYGSISITGNDIKPHSITEQQMAAGSIGSAEIKQHSIAEQDMKANSVGAAELKALSVAAGDIKANAVGSEQIKAGAVAASDIKAGSIGATALQTAAVAAAIQAQLGAAGAAGAPGAPGAPGSAIAYARVNADGTIDPGDSKNIEVVSAGGGIYCLNYTAGTPHVVITIPDLSGSDSRKDQAIVTAVPGLPACPAGSDIEVATASIQLTVNGPRPFYLAVIA